jgi:hypothetical protein
MYILYIAAFISRHDTTVVQRNDIQVHQKLPWSACTPLISYTGLEYKQNEDLLSVSKFFKKFCKNMGIDARQWEDALSV